MRRFSMLAVTIVAVVALSGCAPGSRPAAEPPPGATPPAPSGGGAPAPASPGSAAPASPGSAAPASPGPASPAPPDSTAPPADARPLAALPPWSPAGTYLADKRTGQGMSYTFAPLTIGGVQVQPVQLPGGIAYFKVDGDAVYLAGTDSPRGGYQPVDPPRLLYRLPLKAGDGWEIQYRGVIGSHYAYRVIRIEAVPTPAGERRAAVVDVQRDGKWERDEWWVPGYGLVRTGSDKKPSWTADAQKQETPKSARTVGNPAPGVSALLWDDDKTFRVTTLDGDRELFRVDDGYWRSGYHWWRAGDRDLLAHYHFPGSWGVFLFDALALSDRTGRLEPVQWISSAGEQDGVAGEGNWGDDGRFFLNDFTDYPQRKYVYRFDGQAMRADPKDVVATYAGSARALADRLTCVPPVGKQGLINMFADPAAAAKAWEALLKAGWSPWGGGHVTPDPAAPETAFTIEESGTTPIRFRVEVGLIDGQYRITAFAMK